MVILVRQIIKTKRKKRLARFPKNIREMQEFNCVEFNIGDIVRSGFVRNYLIQKTKLGMEWNNGYRKT